MSLLCSTPLIPLSRCQLESSSFSLDVDNTGYITAANLRTVLGDDFSEAKVQAMIKEADAKQDGRIDFEEFVQVCSPLNSTLFQFDQLLS